jgi:hypothetical protein
MTAAVRWLYAIALGLFVVMTVAFGLVTFFPDPVSPEYPGAVAPRAVPVAGTPTAGQIAEQNRAQQDYRDTYAAWEHDRRNHRRVVLAIVTVIALGCLVGGVLLARAVDVIAIGLMLGGLFSLVWGLGYTASDAGSGVMFGVALLALFVMLAVGTPPVRRRLRHAIFRDGGDAPG